MTSSALGTLVRGIFSNILGSCYFLRLRESPSIIASATACETHLPTRRCVDRIRLVNKKFCCGSVPEVICSVPCQVLTVAKGARSKRHLSERTVYILRSATNPLEPL